MDKRKEANAKARASIEGALMRLLQERSYASISVTDVVREAGVARATYYRNYDSIDDVVDSLLMGLRDKMLSDAGIESDQSGELLSKEVMEPFVRTYRLHRRELLALHRGGLSYSLLSLMADLAASAIGDMPADSIRRYDIYALPGAMYNVILRWLEAGCPESDGEMATYLSELAQSLIGRP